MRRYAIDQHALVDQISSVHPAWIERAQQRTEEYVQAQDYTGGTEFWGQIKRVYIDLQHEKCAYCETKLQGAHFASKVHEVEHFRPKGSVNAWPNKKLAYLADFEPPCPTGGASRKGYYRLAYHPFNYAIACTRCNSTLKSNYFPVRGSRNVDGGFPTEMKGEDPLLIYPISDVDQDPMDLITFEGVLAVPKHQQGPDYERALVTIRFFQLNHEDLTVRRAQILASLWLNLESLQRNPAPDIASQYQRAIDRACSPASEFSACMAAFRVLFADDPIAARELGELANRLATYAR